MLSETILNQDKRVLSSVMFGTGRFNAGVIIDPRQGYRFDPADTQMLSQFRNAIWYYNLASITGMGLLKSLAFRRPTVMRLNEYAPQHSRIFKEVCYRLEHGELYELRLFSSINR